MEDLSKFCCQNPKCRDYGERGSGNLSVCMWYGPEKKRRMLYCSTCKARFSERKGTPLFDARLPEEKIVSLLAHIFEGCGTRKTGRLVGVSKDTVARYCLRAGEHAQQLHDELVAFSPRDARAAVRRKVGLCGQEGGALRS
ncbi:MAG: helix-turn-helix domain-containing protein [Planctomycetota bacterium]